MVVRLKGRSRLLEFILAITLVGQGALPAFATEAHQFNVPSEDAPSAIKDFAAQAHVQILVAGENVKGKRLHAVSGRLSTGKALTLLLADSGLSPRYVGDRSIALIETAASGGSTASKRQTSAGDNPSSDRSVSSAAGDGAKQNSAESAGVQQLQEVLVTAQKKEERLQDAPIPVSVLNTQALSENNDWRVQDYAATVPGLNVMLAGQTKEQLSIRGITTGPGLNPTVGVIVDDVPFGAATDLVGGNAQPNFDPSDLARIEVLRGPQGTLYGASSMGGLVKYVTVDPSTAGFSGQLQAGTLGIQNAGNLGYNVMGAANIPMSDTLAVRVSAFARKDPGYIDDPTLGITGINWSEIDGGRLSALWRPADNISLKVSSLIQRYIGGGTNDSDPALGGLRQFFAAGVGPYTRAVQAHSATLVVHFTGFDLTSISGYNVNNVHDTSDYSPYLGTLLIEPLYGVTGFPLYDHYYAKKLSQEVRLSSSGTNFMDWLVGGFYTHENSQYHSDAYASNLLTGARVADAFIGTDPVLYEEEAAFGDLTFNFTDRFNVQVGGRESRITQTFSQKEIGPLLVPIIYQVPSPFIFPEQKIDNDVFTYLLTPQFKLSPNFMAYARFASGYRPGGINVSQGVGTPIQYDPDRTYDYDLGVKGDFLDHRLAIDTSVFYIDWKNIQINLTSPIDGANYLANGSEAKSEGVEVSSEAKGWVGFTVSGWVDYDDAALTEDFPQDSTARGVAGDPLPFNSRWSGHLMAQQEFPLVGSSTGYFSTQMTYVGQRLGVFTPTFARQVYPSYAQVDVRGGVDWDTWGANLYVNNLTNKRGELGGGLGSFSTSTFYLIQPRTIGVTVSKSF
jgi:iron complex outermembrane recepter protein